MSELTAVDIMLRGAAAAICLFAAVQLARMRPRRFLVVAGSLFGVAVASYALISGPSVEMFWSAWLEPFVLLAVLSPAFFWWFAMALFRDDFALRMVHAVPPLALLVFYAVRQAWHAGVHPMGTLLHLAIVVALLAHVFASAVLEFRNDLVDARRRFRVAVAVLIPLAGFVIASAEIWEAFAGPLPAWLIPLHALLLFVLSFLFVLWLTAPKSELFAPPVEAPRPVSDDVLTPAERIELERLRTAIANGICLKPELSLSALAAAVALPDHRLRRLIGKGLGYRNFAAFLNDHRVAEAKQRLADPKRAREQIAAIAFDLGYASLAPFNRAFRELAGTTPSDYRAQALAKAVDFKKG